MFKTDNLYQNDTQWKDTLLGFSSSVTIGKWGCLLTSATMVVNGLGFKETPLTMNDKMRGVGGFNGASFFPAYVPAAFPGVVYMDYVDCEKAPAPLDRIDAALAAGKPVIVCVDWNPDAGIQTHWVVLKDKKNSNYTMYDPYRYGGDSPSKELILTDRYKYQGTDPSKAILAAIFFDSQNVKPVEVPDPVKVPAGALTVYVVEDGLSFRAEPSVAAYRYKTLALNTALTSLESKADTQAKLGVNGQWLQVQDPSGQQGYVAAWYIATAQKETEPDSTIFETTPATVPVPADAITVQVTEEGLSFRKGPDVAAERIKTFAQGTALTTLESGTVARSKLGVVGQWLRLQDPAGQQGYAAAWYLAEKKTTASVTPSPKPAVQPVDGPVTARTTGEQVALRTKPVVSDDTLVKRLPLGAVVTLVDKQDAGKVGQQDQWVKVKDDQGAEGFIAAWYLAR